jgi:hydroxymethylbilane synthase
MYNLKLGTRGSRLALWQAEYVAAQLKSAEPDINIITEIIKTTGDKVLDVALSRIGDKGLFTREIEKEILDGNIDIAVHSLKDLPGVLPEGLCIGAVLKRENPGDVLISHKGYTFASLPDSAVLGTSSLRRMAQIKNKRPDINIVELRGNVETRLLKMKEQDLDGIILAYAGISRLGFAGQISDMISFDVILPAVGQGAIAIEIREKDYKTRNLIEKINDRTTMIEVMAERAFLKELQGGCQVPIASLAKMRDNKLKIHGLIASLDGKELFKEVEEGTEKDAEILGRNLAKRLLDQGGGKVLSEIKQWGETR